MEYELIVGNVGVVLRTTSGFEARNEFYRWRKASQDGVGRAGGERVTLMRDDEPFMDHVPPRPVRIFR